MLLESIEHFDFYDEVMDKLPNCKKAKEELCAKCYPYAKNNDDDFIVLKVENYYCVAKIIKCSNPARIGDSVIPFDEKFIHPKRRIENKICFKKKY